MLKDTRKWQEIRHQVLVRKVSKRQIIRDQCIGWSTLRRVLAHPLPQPYKRSTTGSSTRRGKRTQSQIWQDILQSLATANATDARSIVTALSAIDPTKATKRDIETLCHQLLANGVVVGTRCDCDSEQAAHHHWLLRIVQGELRVEEVRKELAGVEHLSELVEMAREGNLKQRKKALSVLALLKGISLRCVARFLCIGPNTVFQHWKRYRKEGIQRLFHTYRSHIPRKAKREEVQNAVFSLLHSPPADFGINRTTWTMIDLKVCLAQQGLILSRSVIREVIRAAGYRWRKARIVLTSTDPEYREKLSHIQSILSSMAEDERFFSVDEFGPFSIKMKGGRRLAGPDEFPFVPQIQTSKGFLIITAALELSRNQITHFYSWKKNTVEMLRLLHLLLDQYRGCRKLYFSWDAASWHASKRLYREVDKVNSEQYRTEHGTSLVELAPLPASAQFLNVIESVFSGMAKAIIHNSNYNSVSETMASIDRYFMERNEHFRLHPRRAGKKVWGQELVQAQFDERQNCKDPRW